MMHLELLDIGRMKGGGLTTAVKEEVEGGRIRRRSKTGRRRRGVFIYSCNYIYAHNTVMKEEQKLVT